MKIIDCDKKMKFSINLQHSNSDIASIRLSEKTSSNYIGK